MTYRGSRNSLSDVFPDDPSAWPHYYALGTPGYQSVSMGVGDSLVILQRWGLGPIEAGGVLARAFLLFEMSGTATFTITSDWNIGGNEGYGSGADDWYAAVPDNRVRDPLGSISVNSVGIEKYWLPMPNPQSVHDRAAYDQLLIRVTCTSGTAQFDYIAYQEEAADGYHYASGTYHPSDWIPGPLVEYQVPQRGVFGTWTNVTGATHREAGPQPYDQSIMQDLVSASEGAPFVNTQWPDLTVGVDTWYWYYGPMAQDPMAYDTVHILKLHFGYWAFSLMSLSGVSAASGAPPTPTWGDADAILTGGWSSWTWPTWSGGTPYGQPTLPPGSPNMSEIALSIDPKAIAPIQWRPSTAAVPDKLSALYQTNYYPSVVSEAPSDPVRLYEMPSSMLAGITTLSHSMYGSPFAQLPINTSARLPLPTNLWAGDFGSLGAAMDLDMAGIAPSVEYNYGGRNSVRGGEVDISMWITVQFPDWRFSLQAYVDASGPIKNGIPPLRQRARDDGLAAGSRQEHGHGTSLQSSARRGGRTYY